MSACALEANFNVTYPLAIDGVTPTIKKYVDQLCLTRQRLDKIEGASRRQPSTSTSSTIRGTHTMAFCGPDHQQVHPRSWRAGVLRYVHMKESAHHADDIQLPQAEQYKNDGEILPG
jgi:hypothetical protein